VVTSITLKMNTIFQRTLRSSPYDKQTASIKGLRVSTNHKLYCPHRVDFLLRKPSKYRVIRNDWRSFNNLSYTIHL